MVLGGETPRKASLQEDSPRSNLRSSDNQSPETMVGLRHQRFIDFSISNDGV